MKKYNFYALVALMFISITTFATTSCIRLRNKNGLSDGNLGKVVTKSYNLSDFNEIDLDGIGNIHIAQGKAYSVKVSAPEGAFKHINLERDGHTLSFYLDERGGTKSFSFGAKSGKQLDNVDVYITLPDLKSIDQSGVVNVEIAQPMKVDELSLDVSGVGNTKINGLIANKFTADISGVGNVLVKQLTAKASSFDVSGVGSVNVEYHNSGNSKVEASGVGSVKLSGTLRELDVNNDNIASKVSNNTQLIK